VLVGYSGSAWLVHIKEAGGLMKLIGIVLIVVGVLGLALGGFSYTTREKVVDLGPLQVSADKEHNVPIAPVAGAAALIAGVALVMVGSKSGVKG
jgi:drug/metabolite transporter (DMT)-like permease